MAHDRIHYYPGGFVTYKTYSKILKYLALILIAYILKTFFVKLDWGIIVKTRCSIKFSFQQTICSLLCQS